MKITKVKIKSNVFTKKDSIAFWLFRIMMF